jgi:dihydrofolate reductase
MEILMRKLTYYVAVSLDGFIAGPDGEYDGFLFEGDHMAAITAKYPDTVPVQLHEMSGIAPTGEVFDTVLMGWNTYAVGLDDGADSPYAHLRQYVFSNQDRTVPEDVRLIHGNPLDTVRALKAESTGTKIWLCGGGTLAAAIRDEIDELVLKSNPVVFGSGIPLFGHATYQIDRFERLSVEPFESGVTMVSFRRPT